MEEQVRISHLREIALSDDWVKVTDLMGREYLLDPQVAMALAVWVAEHHQDVAKAQVNLQVARRMEEPRSMDSCSLIHNEGQGRMGGDLTSPVGVWLHPLRAPQREKQRGVEPDE